MSPVGALRITSGGGSEPDCSISAITALVRDVRGVRPARARMHDRQARTELALRRSQLVVGVERRRRDQQGLRIGLADVLAREA